MSGVQSIERAFAILRHLALAPAGVTDIAAATGLPKSTVSRLLGALETESAVEQIEAGGEYRLGPGLEALAGGATGFSFVVSARPFLSDLTDRIGETSGVSKLEDGQVQYLEHVESAGEVQVRDWTGAWAPAHAVPSGMVMLAHAPAEVIDEVLARPLERLVPGTVTDPATLRERLQHIRSVGYAWGLEEFVVGINSVAAPVFRRGVVVGAIHVHGPSYRFPDPNAMHDIGRTVATTAGLLSEQLSGR